MNTNRDDALRAILYEAAVLGAALRALSTTPSPDTDIGRGTDQLAVEAALVKFRSLYELLTGRGRNDDIRIDRLGYDVVSFGDQQGCMDTLRKSINKYCTHISWKRANEEWPDFFLPRPPKFEEYCWSVLRETWRLIECLRGDGCQLNSYAAQYYKHLSETMKNLQQRIPDNTSARD